MHSLYTCLDYSWGLNALVTLSTSSSKRFFSLGSTIGGYLERKLHGSAGKIEATRIKGKVNMQTITGGVAVLESELNGEKNSIKFDTAPVEVEIVKSPDYSIDVTINQGTLSIMKRLINGINTKAHSPNKLKIETNRPFDVY